MFTNCHAVMKRSISMGREGADGVYIHDSKLLAMLIVFAVLLHCLICHQVHCTMRFSDPSSDVSEHKLYTSS